MVFLSPNCEVGVRCDLGVVQSTKAPKKMQAGVSDAGLIESGLLPFRGRTLVRSRLLPAKRGFGRLVSAERGRSCVYTKCRSTLSDLGIQAPSSAFPHKHPNGMSPKIQRTCLYTLQVTCHNKLFSSRLCPPPPNVEEKHSPFAARSGSTRTL